MTALQIHAIATLLLFTFPPAKEPTAKAIYWLALTVSTVVMVGGA